MRRSVIFPPLGASLRYSLHFSNAAFIALFCHNRRSPFHLRPEEFVITAGRHSQGASTLAPDTWQAEEAHLAQVYKEAAAQRAEAVARLKQVLAENGGTPQARSERESYNALYTGQIKALDEAQAGLCFGRIDMVPEAADDQPTRYIGRLGLLSPRTDNEPILIDWRAPIARPYYLATTAHPSGVWRRRAIHSVGTSLTHLSDEFLTAGDVPPGYPEPTDEYTGVATESALLQALNEPRRDYMNDIVATIQQEQDDIIRCPHRGVVVVEGGPGTGKTAVALHRVAYLLYTYRDILSRSGVLIIGPNDTFLRYISHVLPSLGETGVLLSTIGELFPGISASYATDVEAAEVKGSLAMVEVLRAAIRLWQTVPETTYLISVDGYPLNVTPTMIRRARGRARSSRRAHNHARQIFHDHLVREIIRAYSAEIASDPRHPSRSGSLLSTADVAELTEDLLNDAAVGQIVTAHWPVLTAADVVARLTTEVDHLREAALSILSDDEWLSVLLPEALRRLVQPDTPATEVPFSDADIPLLDEAAELVGPTPRTATEADEDGWQQLVEDAQDALDILQASASMEFEDETDTELLAAYDIIDAQRLAQRQESHTYISAAERAINDREWAYGHVIVDEAQELSPMAWRMIMRRIPNRWMTIVGDTAQTSNPAGIEDWETTLSPYVADRWKHFRLTVNYRTPAEVMTVAKDIAREIDDAITLPTSIRRSSQPLYTVDRHQKSWAEAVDVAVRAMYHDPTRSCGVIAPASLVEEIRTEIATLSDGASNALAVLTVAEVKGLEFDYVVIVDPVGIVNASVNGLQDLYVAVTRATQSAAFVHEGELPSCLARLVRSS